MKGLRAGGTKSVKKRQKRGKFALWKSLSKSEQKGDFLVKRLLHQSKNILLVNREKM